MDNVYVVMASTGEYSDRCEWGVRAYATQEEAEAEVKRLDARAMELGVHRLQGGCEARDKYTAEFCSHIDYTGIGWEVMEVPFTTNQDPNQEQPK